MDGDDIAHLIIITAGIITLVIGAVLMYMSNSLPQYQFQIIIDGTIITCNHATGGGLADTSLSDCDDNNTYISASNVKRIKVD